jgi:phosphoribosylanthranilate isomerase
MSSKTKIKICGITKEEDALLASSLGAFALGFIFAGSPRQCPLSTARKIIEAMPTSVISVGVFVNSPLENILQTVNDTNIKAVQLHGQESNSFINELKSQNPGLIVIKTVGVNEAGLDSNPQDYNNCDYFLLDSVCPRQSQGQRPLIQWEKIKDRKMPKPFFIAGGLKSVNVSLVIRELKPFGVDVSSGIEDNEPGRKSPEEMRAFFRSVGELNV